MTRTLLVALLLLVALVPAGASAQTRARAEARDAQAAARCLERFSRGAAHGARERDELSACLAPAMPFPSRLRADQAGWLARCLNGAALALRGARRPAQQASARFHRDACRAVGDALSRWDPDENALTTGRSRAHPEVHVASVAPAQSLPLGEERIAAALDTAASSIAACRAPHGNGRVRVVAQSGARWEVRAWPEEGSAALARCVEGAVRRAARPEGSADTVALDITVADLRPVQQPLLGLLNGAGAPRDGLVGRGVGGGGLGDTLARGAGSTAACRQQTDRLRERLGPPVAAPELVIRETAVPELDAGAPLTGSGAVINVYRSDFPVVLDSDNTQADGAAAGALVARRVPRDRALYIAAHRDVPLSRLFAILGPLEGRGPLHLIVRRPPAEPARAHDPASMARQISTTLAGCREGMAVLRRLSGQLPVRRANLLRDELPAALEQCNCERVDIEQLASLLEQVLEDEPELRALSFTVTRGTAIVLPPNATVGDLARAAASAPATAPPAFSLELR